MKINYVIGDATAPQGEGLKIIPHVCNDVGAWGAGFVLALSRRWKEPEEYYRAMEKYELGTIEAIPVEDDIIVVNMIGQSETISTSNSNTPPVRYVSIDIACNNIANIITGMKKDNSDKEIGIHCPFFGCGLAGGKWYLIKAILEENFIKRGIPVTVYGRTEEELNRITKGN